MSRWKVYDSDIFPSCTSCGMPAPFARYRQRNGINAREITDYCSSCGAKMEGIDECADCPEAKDGKWQDNGVCFACRNDTWVYGKKHNERILKC